MSHKKVSEKIRANAKAMRREMTEAEPAIWNELRAKRMMGLKLAEIKETSHQHPDHDTDIWPLIIKQESNE